MLKLVLKRCYLFFVILPTYVVIFVALLVLFFNFSNYGKENSNPNCSDSSPCRQWAVHHF